MSTTQSLLVAALLVASSAAGAKPQVAIILDDIGYRYEQDMAALHLPAQIAFAVIPGSEHGQRVGRAAANQGREVLIHLPMAPLTGHADSLGHIALDADADEAAVRRVLGAALAELPFARGLNNHMGSLLTQQDQPMHWLMSSLRCHADLYFVDSYTTHHSVALATAHALDVPALRRDVFLDHDLSSAAIERELQRLVNLARSQGQALAIAHPHDETLTALQSLPQYLREHNIELVAPSQLLAAPGQARVARAD